MPALDFADKTVHAASLPLVGGALCLNFANTVSGLREGEHEREHLGAYEQFVVWAAHAGAVGSAEAHALLERSCEDTTGATLARSIVVFSIGEELRCPRRSMWSKAMESFRRLPTLS